MLSSDLRSVYESYQNMYDEGDEISYEMIEEIVEELIEECMEYGYTLDEAAETVEEAAIEYLNEAKVTYGSDTESPEQRRERAKAKVGEKRAEARRTAVKSAIGQVKAKAKGAIAAAGIAGSIAKDSARRAARSAAHSVTYTLQKKKAEVKSGVKSMIGKGLRKAAGAVGKVAQKAAGAASRLGEEAQQLGEGVPLRGTTPDGKPWRVDPPPVGARQPAKKEKNPKERTSPKTGVYTSPKTGVYTSMKKGMREEIDVFDLVLEYLLETGHAETVSEAQYIMSQMDSESIEEILEAQEARNNPEKYEEGEKKKYAPVRGERTPMPPRGNKRREDFEKWYAANVR